MSWCGRLNTDRGVAQFGSALGSGPRGRGFESRHLDQKENTHFWRVFLFAEFDWIAHPFALANRVRKFA